MVAHVSTIALKGLQATPIDVQVQITSGLPAFIIVGLPDKAVAESKERIRAALTSIGIIFPPKRIVVNMAPADLAKEGSHFDLPIACGLLIAIGVINISEVDFLIMGELSLDGKINAVPGVLPAAIYAKSSNLGIIVPQDNAVEASWAGELEIIAPTNLFDLIDHLNGKKIIEIDLTKKLASSPTYPDMKDVKGQDIAKRALEIAAAGGHNLLMSGPPGVGKSMLANRILSILPEMTSQEMLEASMIKSVSGSLHNGELVSHRPFRAPHHSSSVAAMVGGGFGKRTMPGEISLAHHGVLFLDELPEFPRVVLDSLRQPIENGNILIARANSHITYPSKFQLIAAMNPCPCGYLSDPIKACSKAPRCASNYQGKISGPILDRIDIHVELNNLSFHELRDMPVSETSDIIKSRVTIARDIQAKRYCNDNYHLNAHASDEKIEQVAQLDENSQKILFQAIEKFKLSMRSYIRIIKIARTIADLAECENILYSHVTEAINYRIINA